MTSTSGDVRIRLGLRERIYFSPQHIQTAALFARQAYQIEKDYASQSNISDEIITDHRAYVTGALFAAASFLEATINEVFADAAVNENSQIVAQLDIETKQLMAVLWDPEISTSGQESILDKYRLLEKYRLALILAKKGNLKTNVSPYQDVDKLIKLRNILIHYDPMWESGGEYLPDSKLINMLKQEKTKLKLNPLVQGTSRPFFPDQYLSHECAGWAIVNSITFVKEFFSKMGTTSLVDTISNSQLRIIP